MASITEILMAHPAICVECLTRQTQWRSDAVVRELERLGVVAKVGHCGVCTAAAPVYRASR